MDDPLDFEIEDSIGSSSPSHTQKKRTTIICLDDLLHDHYNQQDKHKKGGKKRPKAKKNNDSDNDDDLREAKLFKCVSKFETEIEKIDGGDEVSTWGIEVFGNQKTLPSVVSPDMEKSTLLQSFMKSEINLLVEPNAENDQTFLEGLLVNGWLFNLVLRFGGLESSIATWTINLMLYSPEEKLRVSAFNFWSSIISSLGEVKVERFPTYSEIKRALNIYGFLLDSPTDDFSSSVFELPGPPQNIRAWVKLIEICCHARNTHTIFSTPEAEHLLEDVIYLFLDRQLVGLSMLIYECMLSIINFFTDDEWKSSCAKVAKSVACRTPRDFNSLRIVECISSVNHRTELLKSLVAFEILFICFDKKVSNAEEILEIISLIDVKEKSCNFFHMYIYLVLMENWLLPSTILNEKPEIREKWVYFLQNCLHHINCADMRPYASKVRARASYLLLGTQEREL